MTFSFFDLDEKTRKLMLEELHYDLERRSIYISARLNSFGVTQFPSRLQNALTHGTEESLARDLLGSFNSTEEKKKPKGGFTTATIPVNANKTLAEGEYNRYYVRALCRRAIDEGQRLQVYRAKQVSNPRAESTQKIGQFLEPLALLTDLRNNVDPHLGLAIPNSGLSVRLIM